MEELRGPVVSESGQSWVAYISSIFSFGFAEAKLPDQDIARFAVVV